MRRFQSPRRADTSFRTTRVLIWSHSIGIPAMWSLAQREQIAGHILLTFGIILIEWELVSCRHRTSSPRTLKVHY